jgi:signal transduction histidine kinase
MDADVPKDAPGINFTETELAYVAQAYDRVRLAAGEMLITEGTPGDCAYIVLEGELEVLKASGDRQVLLNVLRRGEIVGEMALLQNRPRMASVRARVETVLIPVNKRQFNEVLDTCPAVTRAMLDTVLQREQMTETRLRQAEHMANWNALTAGVAHELNNPASAIRRATDQLREAFEQFAQAQARLSRLNLTAEQRQIADDLFHEIQERAANPAELSALECSDREDEVEAWLEERGIERAWDLAPALVSLGCDLIRLEEWNAQFDGAQLPQWLAWVCAAFTAYCLLAEMAQASSHISETVGVLKGYSYLDQAPVQTVDVHQGLDNTLLILHGRIGEGVTVQREYAPDLPKIQAYGRELNQVWTAIIDNAITAVDGHGVITIRTRRDAGHDDWIAVDIEDDGPGIPPEVQPMLFDPFFTTKGPSESAALGLNFSYNVVVEKHRGEILVNSEPGRTVFTVRLPVDFEAV